MADALTMTSVTYLKTTNSTQLKLKLHMDSSYKLESSNAAMNKIVSLKLKKFNYLAKTTSELLS